MFDYTTEMIPNIYVCLRGLIVLYVDSHRFRGNERKKRDEKLPGDLRLMLLTVYTIIMKDV